MEKTKKKIVITFVVMLVVIVSLVAGAYAIFNDLFPMASPIQHPMVEDVFSANIACNTTDGEMPISEEDTTSFIQNISSAEATRKQAMNDTPTVRPYYMVQMETAERTYRYFVYEDNTGVYVELPYEGIYKTNTETLDIVLKYYEE